MLTKTLGTGVGMEANAVLLTLVLREAGLSIGAAGAERLVTSMGRLGIVLSKGKSGDVAHTTPAIAHKAPAIATAAPLVTITVTLGP